MMLFSLLNKQKAIVFMDDVFVFCTQFETRSQYEIEDFLEETMNEQFDTLCDDNSVELIATDLVRYMALCRDHQYDVIDRELAAVPAVAQWLTPKFRVQYAQVNDSSSDDEDSGDDDDAMDDTPADTAVAAGRHNSARPARHVAASTSSPSAGAMDTDEDG